MQPIETYTLEASGRFVFDKSDDKWPGKPALIEVDPMKGCLGQEEATEWALELAAYPSRMKALKEARMALLAAKRLFDEAHPKFNWGASFLDANAIKLLNEVPRQVSEALALIGKP
jgi:hypothetical protein